MKRIIEMPGVAVPEATNLPNITRSAEGVAMAHVPGWVAFIDPAVVQGNRPRNRARAKSLATLSGTLTMGEFAQGVPAFNTVGGEIRLGGLPEIDPTQWTAFYVINPVANATASYDLARSIADAASPGLSLRVGLNANAVRASIYEGGTASRLFYAPTVPFIGRTTLLMYTFSMRDGLRIFENGAQVAQNADDKRPLTSGFGANEYQLYRTNRGLTGMTGILSRDLGQPDNAGYRRSIEQFIMAKYNIS